MVDFNDKYLYVERRILEEECSLFVLNRTDGSIHFKFEKQHLEYDILGSWRWLIDGFEFGLLHTFGLKLYVYDEAKAKTNSGMEKFEAIRIQKDFYTIVSFLMYNKNCF